MKKIGFVVLFFLLSIFSVFGQSYNVPLTNPNEEFIVFSGNWLWSCFTGDPLRLLPIFEGSVVSSGVLLYQPLHDSGANYISALVAMPSKANQGPNSWGHIGLLVRATNARALSGYVAYLGVYSNPVNDEVGYYLVLERRLPNDTIDFPVAVKLSDGFDLGKIHELSIRAEGSNPVHLTLTLDSLALIDYNDINPPVGLVEGKLVGLGAVWYDFATWVEYRSMLVGSGAVPLYELKRSSEYFYTLWPDEAAFATAHYGYGKPVTVANLNTQPGPDGLPLQRAYNPTLGRHVFFTAFEEWSVWQKEGYQFEGVAGYIWSKPRLGLVALWRVLSPTGGYQFFVDSGKKSSSLQAVQGLSFPSLLGFILP